MDRRVPEVPLSDFRSLGVPARQSQHPGRRQFLTSFNRDCFHDERDDHNAIKNLVQYLCSSFFRALGFAHEKHEVARILVMPSIAAHTRHIVCIKIDIKGCPGLSLFDLRN